jgi:osmoprotectant transport system permease protein
VRLVHHHAVVAAASALACVAGCGGGGPTVTVASKSFTESVILGEMTAALIRGAGLPVEHRRQLGGTEVVFRALETGAVDVYPEYTGTLTKEILRDEVARRPLADVLAARGIRQTRPLGFDNSYALAMTEARAAALGVRRVSDLNAHPDLRIVVSNEVMNRADGWPGLRARYDLRHEARGMDHDLAYRALASGGADVTDVYTTSCACSRMTAASSRRTRRCCSTARISRHARPPPSPRSSASKASSTTRP